MIMPENENLAQLLLQARFTPQKQLNRQFTAAAQLLEIIDRNKDYPFEFVCFRVTGYRPKTAAARDLIKGDDLARYLRIFLARLGSKLARHVRYAGEPVYTTDRLARKLCVSTKTISRWRSQGLLAHKFIFEDGRKRLGFLQSSVDRFAGNSPALVARAGGFNRLSEKTRKDIVRRAAVLADRTKMSRHRIIARIAAEVGRSHETVRYTLLAHEKANPRQRIFKKPAGTVTQAQAAEIYKSFSSGTSVEQLMKRFNRARSSIYRVINLRRARALMSRKIEYIASDEFLDDKAGAAILAGSGGAGPGYGPGPPGHRAGEKPPAAAEAAGVLNRSQEIELFRRYNYLKYLAARDVAGIDLRRIRGRQLKAAEQKLAEAERIKKIIIEANLRLVLSIAGRHTVSGANMPELVGEGNFALLKAAEKFDYTKGYRFATYASWAIAKHYARKIPAEAPRATAAIEDIQRDLRTSIDASVVAVERARSSLIQVIKDNLDEREQFIILNHFGLTGSPPKTTKKTLTEIGEHLNLTKERIRQVELAALQKLRQCLSIEEFELLKP
jgi:RNA polymerase sigma factor (sigma-70 family)